MVNSETPATADDPTTAVTADFAESARALGDAGGLGDTRVTLLGLAVTMIDARDHAGLVLGDGPNPRPQVATDPVVVAVEAGRDSSGTDPSLEALRLGQPVYVSDLAGDGRWPTFAAHAGTLGVHSVLAMPILTDGAAGVLTLYARSTDAFGAVDRARAILLAAIAGPLLASARTHDTEERRSADLHNALASRELIGQAQGILIERERITADQAFDVLRRASQHLNVKLRDVAQALVDTGEDPDTGPARPGRPSGEPTLSG